jgi:hypothetical protein
MRLSANKSQSKYSFLRPISYIYYLLPSFKIIFDLSLFPLKMKIEICSLLAVVLLMACPCFSQGTFTYHDDSYEFVLKLDTVGSIDHCSVKEIKIRSLNSKQTMQTIIPPDNIHYCRSEMGWIFIVEDMNFDGKNDFRLMELLQAGPNTPYIYWLHESGKFNLASDTTLQQVTSPEFDKINKIVSSFWRNGCCEHGQDFYRYEKTGLVLYERRVIGHDENDKEYTEVWTLKDGVLRKQ